jgi:hypothetical protein
MQRTLQKKAPRQWEAEWIERTSNKEKYKLLLQRQKMSFHIFMHERSRNATEEKYWFGNKQVFFESDVCCQ